MRWTCILFCCFTWVLIEGKLICKARYALDVMRVFHCLKGRCVLMRCLDVCGGSALLRIETLVFGNKMFLNIEGVLLMMVIIFLYQDLLNFPKEICTKIYPYSSDHVVMTKNMTFSEFGPLLEQEETPRAKDFFQMANFSSRARIFQKACIQKKKKKRYQTPDGTLPNFKFL